ncbi:CPX1 [Symbiodinium sp. CCMP2592]|nr:CPX1 [Symbiodinium sp. CCMP2592]
MSEHWTSAVPTPKPQRATAWRLLDVSLIIVGSGPEAERLLQRRLGAGGRACLLWTDRPPSSPLPSELKSAESRYDQVLFDAATFRWQPPALENSCPEVRALRRRYGSADYGFMRTGPDVVALAQHESYQLVLEGQDLVGVRVLLHDAVSWELSGAVLLVGPVAAVLPPLRPGSGSEGWIETVDVHVQQEEAFPQMYCDGGGLVSIAAGSAYYLLMNFCCYLLVHNYDRHVQPGDVAWWWLFPHLQALSGQIWSHHLADCLLGFQQGCKSTVVGCLVSFLVWYLWMLVWVLGLREWKLQYFVHAVIGFELSSVAQLIVSTLLSRSARISPYNAGKSKNNKGQALWTGVLLSMNMVVAVSQWSVIVLYMYLDSVSTILSAVVLSLATAASELLAVSFMENVYLRLVWPRAFADQLLVVLADQNTAITVLIAFTHAVAESTRLTSLLSAAAQSEGWNWQWIVSLLIMLSTNVAVRHGYHVSLFCRVLPEHMHKWVRPGCCSMIHRHGRVVCGYFRFIPYISYVAFRLVGFSGEPLFNPQTLALYAAVLFMELLEDAVVLLRILPLDPWQTGMKHLYAELHPFHPKQVMCKDSRGVQEHLPPLRLHGARRLPWIHCQAPMQISFCVSTSLLWLPLGAGFVFGICPEPIPPELRLSDAFFWSQPFRCG